MATTRGTIGKRIDVSLIKICKRTSRYPTFRCGYSVTFRRVQVYYIGTEFKTFILKSTMSTEIIAL